ncbi:MAG: class I SAM-dependent methyltransferase [Candidatus Moranbacteria bacterium]|nr:class I SAM-dependent methyltransferase [Candidatus Moranbacteria bacterium]
MEKNIYEKMYDDWKNSGNLSDSPRIKVMLSMLDRMNMENKNILDIGCHDGTFLSLAKNRNNNFFGLEASEWGAEKSRGKGIQVTKYFFNDADKLPYQDSFFDAVVAGEIIEHIFDTDFFLEEIKRVLKPGGKLIISTPNIVSLGRRLLMLLGISPIIEISPNCPESVGHIRYFTFKAIERLIRKHDFAILSLQSDCVNFSENGRIKSALLAKIFPRLGASIICLATIK